MSVYFEPLLSKRIFQFSEAKRQSVRYYFNTYFVSVEEIDFEYHYTLHPIFWNTLDVKESVSSYISILNSTCVSGIELDDAYVWTFGEYATDKVTSGVNYSGICYLKSQNLWYKTNSFFEYEQGYLVVGIRTMIANAYHFSLGTMTLDIPSGYLTESFDTDIFVDGPSKDLLDYLEAHGKPLILLKYPKYPKKSLVQYLSTANTFLSKLDLSKKTLMPILAANTRNSPCNELHVFNDYPTYDQEFHFIPKHNVSRFQNNDLILFGYRTFTHHNKLNGTTDIYSGYGTLTLPIVSLEDMISRGRNIPFNQTFYSSEEYEKKFLALTGKTLFSDLNTNGFMLYHSREDSSLTRFDPISGYSTIDLWNKAEKNTNDYIMVEYIQSDEIEYALSEDGNFALAKVGNRYYLLNQDSIENVSEIDTSHVIEEDVSGSSDVEGYMEKYLNYCHQAENDFDVWSVEVDDDDEDYKCRTYSAIKRLNIDGVYYCRYYSSYLSIIIDNDEHEVYYNQYTCYTDLPEQINYMVPYLERYDDSYYFPINASGGTYQPSHLYDQYRYDRNIVEILHDGVYTIVLSRQTLFDPIVWDEGETPKMELPYNSTYVLTMYAYNDIRMYPNHTLFPLCQLCEFIPERILTDEFNYYVFGHIDKENGREWQIFDMRNNSYSSLNTVSDNVIKTEMFSDCVDWYILRSKENEISLKRIDLENKSETSLSVFDSVSFTGKGLLTSEGRTDQLSHYLTS